MFTTPSIFWSICAELSPSFQGDAEEALDPLDMPCDFSWPCSFDDVAQLEYFCELESLLVGDGCEAGRKISFGISAAFFEPGRGCGQGPLSEAVGRCIPGWDTSGLVFSKSSGFLFPSGRDGIFCQECLGGCLTDLRRKPAGPADTLRCGLQLRLPWGRCKPWRRLWTACLGGSAEVRSSIAPRRANAWSVRRCP